MAIIIYSRTTCKTLYKPFTLKQLMNLQYIIPEMSYDYPDNTLCSDRQNVQCLRVLFTAFND